MWVDFSWYNILSTAVARSVPQKPGVGTSDSFYYHLPHPVWEWNTPKRGIAENTGRWFLEILSDTWIQGCLRLNSYHWSFHLHEPINSVIPLSCPWTFFVALVTCNQKTLDSICNYPAKCTQYTFWLNKWLLIKETIIVLYQVIKIVYAHSPLLWCIVIFLIWANVCEHFIRC